MERLGNGSGRPDVSALLRHRPLSILIAASACFSCGGLDLVSVFALPSLDADDDTNESQVEGLEL